ncbi:MAG: GAF domain-containing protein, partial [Chloroflexota bacterium]
LQAQLRRVLVCEGVCQEQNRSPYHPWVSILKQVIAYTRSITGKIAPSDAAALVKLMPEMSEHIGPLAQLGEHAYDQQSLLEAVTHFLMVHDRPLMVVLEDLNNADNETIEFMNYLGQRAGQGNILLFGLYRDDELDSSHPLNGLVKRAILVQPGGQELPPEPVEARPYIDLLRLKALDETEAAEMVRSMLGMGGAPAGGEGSLQQDTFLSRLMPRLMTETGGNPLFIEALMRSLVDEDLLQNDGGHWQIDIDRLTHVPAGIQDVARRRLARLFPESLDLLQWAAVLGHSLNLDLLQAVSGLSAEEIFRHLSYAVQANILGVHHSPGGPYSYRFSTDQMRLAIYATLSDEERLRRHRVTGETLCQLYPAAGIPERLAWHFERAGDLAHALAYTRMAAEKACQVYANESAIQYYTRALALIGEHPRLAGPETTFEILAALEESNRLLGNRQAQEANLERMEKIATGLGDSTRKTEVINRRVSLAVINGNHTAAMHAAESGLELAQRTGNRRQEAESLIAISEASYWLDDFAYTQLCAEHAMEIYAELGDRQGEAKSLRWLALTARRQERIPQAKRFFEQALEIYRSLNNRLGEADILNGLGIIETNYAHKRNYYELSLAIVDGIGDRYRQARAYNNLGLLYSNLGLYRKACSYLEKAAFIQRETQSRSGLAYTLESLGRVYLELEEYELARTVLEEGLEITHQMGSPVNESLFWMALGRLALAQGRAEDARGMLSTAVRLQREMETSVYLVTSLAWLGYTLLVLKLWDQAYHFTSESIEKLEELGNTGSFPTQDVLWLHYQVLREQPQEQAPGDSQQTAELYLQRAHDAMLSAIATLSDEGLRRNYLNRVKINRDILTEWVRRFRQSPSEQEPEISALTEEARLTASELHHVKDKFKRVLDISLRMNETRDVGVLLEYVMDQVIELSGAERGFLVLFDEAGRMDFKVTRGMAQTELERTKTQLSYTVMGAVAQSKQPILLQDALSDEHFGRQSSVLDLHLRSVLCVPLLSHSELIGAIYADNRTISGRFSQADVDLLTIFASQAATAIENARLHEEMLQINKKLEQAAQSLEQRVNERTAALK